MGSVRAICVYWLAMFRLTRQVRFSINTSGDGAARGDSDRGGVSNGYGGYPSLAGVGHFFALDVSVAGELNPASSYLVNIKDIDRRVREAGVEVVAGAIGAGRFGGGGGVVGELFDLLDGAWGGVGGGVGLEQVRLWLSPYLSVGMFSTERPMVRLSQKFEFSASHRLFNSALSDEENRKIFGKCSNPYGHGHNYELQVTLRGEPDANGVVAEVPAFERVVAEAVVERFDHKNLNIEVLEFKELIPSVENIARVIYRILKGKFTEGGAMLQSVTVWETPKTWCEYSE